MKNEPPETRLARFAPKPASFIKRVNELAADSRNVKWSAHARERMHERDISIREAITVLREGYLSGEIESGKGPGEWKAKIVRNIRGRRDVGVAMILVKESQIFVKTVEWEDTR